MKTINVVSRPLRSPFPSQPLPEKQDVMNWTSQMSRGPQWRLWLTIKHLPRLNHFYTNDKSLQKWYFHKTTNWWLSSSINRALRCSKNPPVSMCWSYDHKALPTLQILFSIYHFLFRFHECWEPISVNLHSWFIKTLFYFIFNKLQESFLYTEIWNGVKIKTSHWDTVLSSPFSW